MYTRLVDLGSALKLRSIFLLGPRQTGKSTLVRHQFPEAKYFNLLQADAFRQFSAAPETMRQSLAPNDRLVIIDEIQKLPSLLDEVQFLIDSNKNIRFILTGSSARKLKRGGANLLAGRALMANLHPLVSPEVEFKSLLARINRGSLPGILDSPIFEEDLNAYVGTYLQEEIRAEGLVRSIENFSRFLAVAGFSNGEQLNFESVANDAQVPARTVREFFQILEDTLVGYQLHPFQKTKRRKPVASSKFYFFDVGVTNSLIGRFGIRAGTEAFGRALEHLIFLELRAYLDYRRLRQPITFWRSQSQLEVDFVIGDELAIEVKGTGRVAPRDARGLIALSDEVKLKHRLIVCNESTPRTLDNGIEIVPIDLFFKRLWADTLINGS